MIWFYFCLLLVTIRISNVYFIWLLLEINTVFFFIYIIGVGKSEYGLVVYYFFQRVLGLIVLILLLIFSVEMLIWVLLAKLGVFPFFYWVVVVSVKVSILRNIFILVLQKVRLVWIIWLVINWDVFKVIMLVYLGLVFGVIMLVGVRDLWLFLIYSSVVNSSLLVIVVYGNYMIRIMFLYFLMVVSVIVWLILSDNFLRMFSVVYYFIIVPPFVLFFFKIMLVLGMARMVKVVIFFMVLDVFVLFYYFGLMFINFMVVSGGGLFYFMNFFMVFVLLLFRNCVALIIFY